MADSSASAVFFLDDTDHKEQGVRLSGTNLPNFGGLEGPSSKSSPNLRRNQGKESRLRTESASDAFETDHVSELQHFRTRSRSAPSSILVAARYGRELRRMSDEFDQTIMGLPRPKSAGEAGQLTGNKSVREIFMGFFGRRKSKGKDESGAENQ
ncbi:bcl2-associated agonist of cell death isoform 1-T2 [Rhinophrynus dorsalis]